MRNLVNTQAGNRIEFGTLAMMIDGIKGMGNWRLLASIASVSLFSALLSCSGGGGGGGGGGRTTERAVRIVHGAIDAAPVDLYLNGVFLESAHYGESTSYVPVDVPDDSFPTSISVSTANTPSDVLQGVSQPLKEDTEYSMFLYGNEGLGTFQIRLVEDTVIRPEKGRALIRFMHAYEGRDNLSARSAGAAIPKISFGNASEFVDVPSGAQTIEVLDSNGRTVASVPVVIEDRGEITLLVAGDTSLGVVFTTVFSDLD